MNGKSITIYANDYITKKMMIQEKKTANNDRWTGIVMYTEGAYFVFSEVSPIHADTGNAPSTSANPRSYPRPAGAYLWVDPR
jgi:hypothetical protein